MRTSLDPTRARAREDGPAPVDLAVVASGVGLVALRAVGDAAAAADIAQEAVARAMTAAEQRGSEIGDMRAFIHGIVRHLVADYHRHQRRHVDMDSVDEPAVPGKDALDEAIAADERARLSQAIDRLGDRDREVITLYYVDALDDAAIAARLHDNATNIRKRRSRAIARLRLALGHKLDASPTNHS
jgi:RNA polymerase sigma factor (sigma-70 family)